MSLERSDIKKLARLARLYLTEHEEEVIQDELNHIFDLIQEMQSIDEMIDMQKVLSFNHQHARFQLLREDKVTEQNQRELFQSVAPEVKDGFYTVPKVIE
ncbi:MAG: Asp-tRNA(Asn)/Glu-tRNA(Gln) amidotransferase subunit GatC [Neisseriaceae bacterium]|nr:Asp-tRNA(Asn)/Glu-tRNA(Gln) amidotransferase subunit GatC [Neisseriaceae bacterium]MCV2509201.1 Asp-tRNA(Asn)/Glu-tRNA(Gln) amidotransferase subunit GatC [Neisseriaceae bacterium]